MRGLLQRVSSASVSVHGTIVGSIGRGIVCFVGIAKGDVEADAVWLVKKLATLRLFDEGGKAWTGSVGSLGLQVLLVSQFTLHATTRKPKPSFSAAAAAEDAGPLFSRVVDLLRAELPGEGRVATGVFREMMLVNICNDGPVTISIDSWNRGGGLLPAGPPGAVGDGGDKDDAVAVGESHNSASSSASAAVATGTAVASLLK